MIADTACDTRLYMRLCAVHHRVDAKAVARRWLVGSTAAVLERCWMFGLRFAKPQGTGSQRSTRRERCA